MQRKLAAILCADIVGYSGLMEADETGTLTRLKLSRSTIFDPYIAAHGGRVFKLMGDGALAEFPSAVEAVQCALAIQSAMRLAEPDIAEERRLRYRIGINLGDIIIDGEDIYGDGVNVAARLQTLAPVGGVALSAIVRDQVEGKTQCHFEDMGEHSVKNIERPVHVFSVQTGSAESRTRKAEGPRMHAICVLPFTNMSGDPEQEYFSDGISEDIITDLSKVSVLEVVARNTAFQFKGKNVDIVQIARQLKASHIIEGSVRKVGGRVRISAQLIDGKSGNHVWAERYDRDLNDIFAVQDEISEAIVRALKLKLLPDERRAIEQRGTSSADAYKFYLMARELRGRSTVGVGRRGEAVVRLATRATDIDPGYANAWALMALAQNSVEFNLARKGDGGLAAASRALALDDSLADAHAAMASALVHHTRIEEAGPEVSRALDLDPESYEVVRAAAAYSFVTRNISDAIRYFEKAAALKTYDFSSLSMLLTCYQSMNDEARTRDAARRLLGRVEPVIAVEPDDGSAMSMLLAALAVLGEADRAKDLLEKALVLDPENWNMRYNFACTFIRNLGDVDTGLDLLEPNIEKMNPHTLLWTKTDPDLDPVRNHPRFRGMIEQAEARLAKETAEVAPSPNVAPTKAAD